MSQLSSEAIYGVLDAAQGFLEVSRRTIKKVPSLRGRTILNVFYEASTRTRVSFELAAKRLSADAVNITVSGSSVQKGESLIDTVQTLNAMQADAVVMRHSSSGAPHFVAARIKARVLNAGDGQHEHPSQALL
ncbi:MAG: aspartate carbamoyltransferase, partial [Deltaproteobacteria bacterium]|nr:aspartate carbamoyltransferase [Deltaproteobacteria bacterium]